MGFLDTAKEKATQFTELAKKKVDDLKGKRKSGALLTDLGRTVFRQFELGKDIEVRLCADKAGKCGATPNHSRHDNRRIG